ncbi:MAG TPA: hypothetical protein VNG33_16245 [Polyangiaceae bacterium]|nr:hypothetical protein [Polyangiaceae bacterium]
MRNSWKLGLFAALGASVTFVGCSDGATPDASGSGASTSGAGKGGSAGGTTINISGTTSGGSSAGTTTTGGASAGSTTGGSTTAGSAGHAGSGGSAGTTTGGASGSGGASAGSGGSAAGSGGSAAGSGGSSSGAGGTGGGSGGVCDDGDGFSAAGSGGVGSVVTAIVLVDNVIVKDAAAAAYKSWVFADATDILDDKVGNVGDKWVRFPFDAGSIGNNTGAHDVFSKCDGNPKGSLKTVVPFTMAGQYFEVGLGFASHDWSNYTVTADVKLLSGGNSQAGCPGHAELFINGAGGPTVGPSQLITTGGWVALALTAPATGATAIDHLGVRITSYTCL